MIYKFHVAFEYYLKETENLKKAMKTSFPAEFQANYAFGSAVDDLSGSAVAALAAYRDFLPWFLDEEIERTETFANAVSLPPEMIMKWVESSTELSSSEKEFIAKWQSASAKQVQAMIQKGENKKRTGYEGQRAISERGVISTFKSFLFFCRVLQDASYRVGLIASGNPAGAHSSMVKVFSGSSLKKDHPMFDVLSSIDGYPDWFLAMRELRNEVKKGIGGSILGSFPDIGIGVPKMSREGALTINVSNGFTVASIIRALEMSGGIASKIAAKIQ